MEPKRTEGFLPRAVKPYLVAVGAGALTITVFLLLFAWILTVIDLPATGAVAFSTVAMAAGGLVCGFVAARIQESRGLLNGILAGAILFAVHLMVSLCSGGGPFTLLTPARLAVAMLMSAVGGIAGVNLRARRKLI